MRPPSVPIAEGTQHSYQLLPSVIINQLLQLRALESQADPLSPTASAQVSLQVLFQLYYNFGPNLDHVSWALVTIRQKAANTRQPTAAMDWAAWQLIRTAWQQRKTSPATI